MNVKFFIKYWYFEWLLSIQHGAIKDANIECLKTNTIMEYGVR